MFKSRNFNIRVFADDLKRKMDGLSIFKDVKTETREKKEEEAEEEVTEETTEEAEEESDEEAEEEEAGKKASTKQRPQARKTSKGAKSLGAVTKAASSEVNDLSQLWESAPDVTDVFGS